MLSAGPARHRFAIDPQFRRRILFSLLGGFSVVGWMALLFGGTLFSVREITVEGGEGIAPHEATALVFRILDEEPQRFWHAKRHAWFLPKERLREFARTEWFARDVQVLTSPWSNNVRLIVTQEPRVVFLKTAKQYLEIDPRGFVRSELSPENRLIVIQSMTGATEPSVPDHVRFILDMPDLTEALEVRYRIPVDAKLFERWIRLREILEAKHLSARYGAIQQGEERLILVQNVSVAIDTLESLESQIQALALYQEKAKEQRLPLETLIDVRIQGRVYVR